MPQVTWSARAEADLRVVVTNPAVRDQLRDNAAKILQDAPPRVYPADEYTDDEIMWHRGITNGQERQIEAGWLPEEADDGAQAWDYFLIYRSLNPAGFEVLAVRSTGQIAGWEQMYRVVGHSVYPVSCSALQNIGFDGGNS